MSNLFTIKADIIRMTAGLALFNLLDHWVFTTAGAILILLSGLNFAIHLCRPDIMQAAAQNFEDNLQ